MKSLYQIVFLLLAVLALGVVSCRKNPEASVPSPPAATTKLARIQTGDAFNSFVYNNEGSLVEIKDSVAGATQPVTTMLQYTGGRLARVLYGFMTYTFEYPNNTTLVVKTGSVFNPELEVEVYTFAGNQLREQIRYYALTNQPELKTVYTYNNAGNLAKQEEYAYDASQPAPWKPVSTAVFTYDDKPNETASVEGRQFARLAKNAASSKNNPLKIEWFNGANQPASTRLFQYEYDSKGRKTKQVEETVVNGRITNRQTRQFIYH